MLLELPAFLREIHNINEGPHISEKAILVSLDVTALYDNVPYKKGLESIEEALEDGIEQKVLTALYDNVPYEKGLESKEEALEDGREQKILTEVIQRKMEQIL